MTDLIRAYPPTPVPAGAALWLPFRAGELLVQQSGEALIIIRSDKAEAGDLVPTDPIYLGMLGGLPAVAWNLPDDAATPSGMQLTGLRSLLSALAEDEAALAGYALQMLDWRRTSRFCPVCGHETEAKPKDWGRHCPNCGYDRYPQVSPAVLALVHDGDRILLAQRAGWASMFSILAGFVEPGETLEMCVRREVKEEVGLEIDDIVYYGSQSWPFPHQLMVGFTARYVGGKIEVETEELDKALWFPRGALPDLPPPISLSRRLIDAWEQKVL